MRVSTDEHDDVATSGDGGLTSQLLPLLSLSLSMLSVLLLLFLGASEDCKLQLLEFPVG